MHGILAAAETRLCCPLCIGCNAVPPAPRSWRCAPCKVIRARYRLQRFYNSEKGKLAKERMREINRAYYQRQDIKAKRRVKVRKRAAPIPGAVRYSHKFSAHVHAWRLAVRKAADLASATTPKGPLLAYPFVRQSSAGNSTVLAVNALVPRGMSGREDICQNIVLAILEGRTTVAELHANRKALLSFYRAHHRESFELSGYAVSLNEPRHDGQSWVDVLPETATPWA